MTAWQNRRKLMQQLGVATISSAEGASNPYDSTSQTVRDAVGWGAHGPRGGRGSICGGLKGDGSAGSAALDTAADEAIATDAGLSGVRSNLNTRRATLVEEMNGMRPDHPIYQKDKQEIASIDDQLSDLRRSAAKRLQEKLRQDVTRTRMVELQLIRELAREDERGH